MADQVITDQSGEGNAQTAADQGTLQQPENAGIVDGNQDGGQSFLQSNDGAGSNVNLVNREFQEKSVLRRARELNMPYINIGKTPLNPDFFEVFSYETAQNARIIPFFKVGKKLRIAVQDKDKAETLEAIKSLQEQGYEVDINLASQSGIDDALKIYEGTQKYKKMDIVETVEAKSIKTYEKEIAALNDLSLKLDTVTAEEGLNLLNIGAMKTRASDVHYEPEEDGTAVRFRIDGVLHEVFRLKTATYKNLSNQLKYDSRMQLNVNTVPQDGRYSFTFNETRISVRVSSIPTPYGESFVCRYLVGDQKLSTFEELGFQGLALTKIQNLCKISHGMVLATGPTGSGKTTTLYALLNKFATPESKVITLEDPVEYQVDGVTQSQIDEKRGYNFADGLRAILRQDPDVVMIGEIRDLETADTAAQAALTGHVLLSTLHTNSAIESIPRLINMGLKPFMIAPALDTVIAQRLVRKVCPKCVTMEALPDAAKKEFEEMQTNFNNIKINADFKIPEKISQVHGCDECSQTGYSGRLVIVEMITINETIKNLILENASLVDLIAAARKSGMTTMREDGFVKVAQGLTTLEEVYRVTNVAI